MRRAMLPLRQATNQLVDICNLLAGFPLALKSPDFWRLKNQALKSPEIGHWP